MSLIIIDYDETFTTDKQFWSTFVKMARASGKTVVCCTMRVGNEYVDADVIEDMKTLDIPVVFAAIHADKYAAMSAAGYDVESAIWIDDNPQYIVMGGIND
jgi:orotidine-5'-phosphate decarboxylase